MAIEKLSPALVYKIWGGHSLAKLKGVPAQIVEDSNELLGETWEVSVHPGGPSRLSDGRLLTDLLSPQELPYLVKFIEAQDDLSIQVHPGDDYAQKFEGEKGKSECWLILDHEPGAGIYLGLKEGITKNELETALKDKDDISQLLNFYPVKKGDFFFVPHGSIHAIGAGVILAEIQQSSGVTYRVWDWNRVNNKGVGRELHINKALDVINFEPEKNEESFFKPTYSDERLIEHRDFEVRIFETSNQVKVDFDHDRPRSIINLEGELIVAQEKQESSLMAYDVAIIMGKSEIEMKPRGSVSKFIVVS